MILNAQYGFKKGCTAIVALYVLKSIVNLKFANVYKLFCTYKKVVYDFRRVFGTVGRNTLYNVKLGEEGKMLRRFNTM